MYTSQKPFFFSNCLYSFFSIEPPLNPSQPHKVSNYLYSQTIYKPLPYPKLLLISHSSLSLLDINIDLLPFPLLQAIFDDKNQENELVSLKSHISQVQNNINSDQSSNLNHIDPHISKNQHDIDYFLQLIFGTIPPSPPPISHNYSGHQFGHYVGQLGDGRSLSLGDIINLNFQKWELNLKGTGKTPYSREADGRSMLRSCIKEFLFSEYIYKLGGPTIRALAVIGSFKELVERDLIFEGTLKMEPAGIICRLSPNYIRFGSFEILLQERLFQGEGWESYGVVLDMLKRMVEFVLEYDFKEIDKKDQRKYEIFYEEVVRRTAKMAGFWQAYGFCHGGLNTDNMSILGLTLDYETGGFLEEYDPEYNANSMDYSGRHCFKEQVGVLAWNLVKLAESIKGISDYEQNIAFLKKEYGSLYNKEYYLRMTGRIGLFRKEDGDGDLVNLFLKLLRVSKSDYTNAFRWLCFLESPIKNITAVLLEIQGFCKENIDKDRWLDFLKKYEDRVGREEIDKKERKEKMKNLNPKYVIRKKEMNEAMEFMMKEEGDSSQIMKIYNEILSMFK